MFRRKSGEREEETVERDDASYAAGLEAGIRKYAWLENGIEYVGSRPKTRNPMRLEAALEEAGIVKSDIAEGGDDDEPSQEGLPGGEKEEEGSE